MSQVIAGIYEIQKQIGAGGGGIVYLGRHIRLGKQVVLKADKRTLSIGTEKLRREVDMLKNLSQTYIPQVYDFVQEDGVVYTVMDYIEGESLDKLLGRQQIPSQPDVIKWACQLLEALSYLHKQPPYGILHGDIKPANIMLRPSGDICLIDFNIALALGEDGAVKVGFSRGYASPEHYGTDYISSNRPAAVDPVSSVMISKTKTADDKTMEADLDKTMVDEDVDKTLVESSISKDVLLGINDRNYFKNTASAQSDIKLDVRSDIYSLGATLYHLISGKRPAQDALEVVLLGPNDCSPTVSAIIQKAMAPQPENRYQTAEEMLNDFLQIHKCDKRVIRRKRRIIATTAALAVTFLVGGACTFVGLKQLEQRQTALTLAEYSTNALAEGDVSGAVMKALQAIPTGGSILEAPVTAQAQNALTAALDVYNLSDGFSALDVLRLPSVPFDVTVSPGEKYFAAVYAYEMAVYDMSKQERVVILPIQNSALSDIIFTDETHIVYAGEQGVTLYDLGTREIVWVGEVATTLSVSGDNQIVAAVNRDDNHAVVYRIADGEMIAKCSFGDSHLAIAANDIFADPDNNMFALNEDGSMLAVSFSNGGMVLFDINHPENDLIVYEESDYKQFEGDFSGDYFVFTAEKSGEALFGLVNIMNGVYIGGYESQDSFLLQVDEQEIYLANGNLLVNINPTTLEEKEIAYTDGVAITNFSVGKDYVLVATEDNCFSVYDSGANLMLTENCNENCDFLVLIENYAIVANRNEPSLRLLKLENHSNALLLSYDARYEHDEARISQDGKTAMLFGYQNFRIYDMQGEILADVELPDSDNIYDQQFRKSKEGSWLEVIWYDGTRRCYSASDGSVISEETVAEPSEDLYEEFWVEEYRIESSLHTAPRVYQNDSDKLIATLEEDAYLTYVTQIGEYIITEYISAAGERYGILLNNNFEKLAYLPNLCDVMGETLVFDYQSGNLRQSRLYSLQELVALGEVY